MRLKSLPLTIYHLPRFNRGLPITNRGFTLVETLIGLAIIGVVGTVIFGVLNRTFQSNSKTIAISTIKQNGQNAITQIDQMIRGADSLVCIGNSNATITLLKSGVYQRITFYPQTSSANGYIAVDYPIPQDSDAGGIFVCTTSPKTTPYKRCPDNFCATGFTPTTNQIILTDQNNNNGVSVQPSGTYFSKQSNPGSQDSMTINFDLSPAINSGNTFEKSLGNGNKVNFTTSIDLR